MTAAEKAKELHKYYRSLGEGHGVPQQFISEFAKQAALKCAIECYNRVRIPDTVKMWLEVQNILRNEY